jgi:hypothetical protein
VGSIQLLINLSATEVPQGRWSRMGFSNWFPNRMSSPFVEEERKQAGSKPVSSPILHGTLFSSPQRKVVAKRTCDMMY